MIQTLLIVGGLGWLAGGYGLVHLLEASDALARGSRLRWRFAALLFGAYAAASLAFGSFLWAWIYFDGDLPALEIDAMGRVAVSYGVVYVFGAIALALGALALRLWGPR